MSMKYESHLAGSCGGGGFLYNAYVEKFMNVAGMLERERDELRRVLRKAGFAAAWVCLKMNTF